MQVQYMYLCSVLFLPHSSTLIVKGYTYTVFNKKFDLPVIKKQKLLNVFLQEQMCIVNIHVYLVIFLYWLV